MNLTMTDKILKTSKANVTATSQLGHQKTKSSTQNKVHPLKKCPLKIVSWNICDSTDKVLGDKTNEDDFLSVVSESTIFCLQETKKEVNIANYKCYNGNRKNSRSGGVCLGVHRSLEKYVKPLPTDDPDIVAIKISGIVSTKHKDIAIVNVYDSPERSSYNKQN